MHIVLLSILLHTLLIYLPIYAASHSFTQNMTAVPIYQATRCYAAQASNLQNQSLQCLQCWRSIGSCDMQVKVSAWLIEHHGIKLYTTVDLWLSIFVISKVNEVSVIRYTFHHSYPSRIILRYSLNRKLCGLLRYCECFRGKYIALTVNRIKI